MDETQGHDPIVSIETLRGLLRKTAQESSVDAVLRTVIHTLADLADAAVTSGHGSEALESLRKRLDSAGNGPCEGPPPLPAFGEIIGQSAAVRSLAEKIELVAPTDASVLILGESGTGKELVAREIHRRSRRRAQRMVQVNCASIPRELYESEFFGHVRGAFTGALKDRAGRFELAHRGTLLLDEVGEIPYHLQGKLLRVLQEREFERVGEEVTRRVDVRILAATNRDLKQEIEDGRFRRDLFYRLNVFPIEVVPLRQRSEDIPFLASYFLDQAVATLRCPRPRLTKAHILQLQQYDWPGNIRELRNVVERAVIASRGGELRLDLSGDLADETQGTAAPTRPTAPTGEILPDAELRRLERQNILAALERSRWKIYGPGGAAELLGVRPTTLASRIKRLRLQKPDKKENLG